MEEEWRPIEGYEDYDVSNLGRVRSWRGNGNGTRATSAKILVQKPGTNGRPKVELCCGERRLSGQTKSKTFYIHRLVANTFIGTPPVGEEVRHLDGNVTNNKLSNLKFGTVQENIDDKRRHGTFIEGSKSNLAKLNENDVVAIRASSLTPTELANHFNTTRNNIYLILARKTWRHV